MLRAASNQRRLAILLSLGEHERDTGQVCGDFGTPKAIASRDLTTLRQGGLVTCTRHGQHRIHDLTDVGCRLAAFVRRLSELTEEQPHLLGLLNGRIVSLHDDKEPQPHSIEPRDEPV